MDALDIIEVFARRGTGRIIFTFSDGNVTVESSSSSVGGGKKRSHVKQMQMFLSNS